MQAHAPTVDAVVVSSLGDDATVLQAIRGGAVGYLLKNGSDAELELSLGSMRRGGAPIDPVIARRILQLIAAPQPAPVALANIGAAPAATSPAELSARETQVLQLVAQGHSNREIKPRASSPSPSTPSNATPRTSTASSRCTARGRGVQRAGAGLAALIRAAG